MKTGNDGFARKIAEQLEKSANDLDSHTRMRLRGMRRRAIEQASRKTPFWFRGTPMLAFASVAAIALTVALWPRPPGPLTDVTTTHAVQQIEPVDAPTLDAIDDQGTDEYPIAFEEDLEFYQWLDQQLGDS
jgi:hypothetical protein